MSQRTPEKNITKSSRNPTPHSRRQSKTPVRTPRRRRATIVSANLLTPRRHRRPSATPQNTLRILSRALSKHVEEQPQKETLQLNEKQKENAVPKDAEPEQDIEAADYVDFDYQEDLDRRYEEQIGEVDEQHNLQWEDEEGKEQDNEAPLSPELQRGFSVAHSDRFSQPGLSDIALPAGIMPDEELDSGPFSDPFQFDTHPESEAVGLRSSFMNTQDLPSSQPGPGEQPSIKVPSNKLIKRLNTTSSELYSRPTIPFNNRKLSKFAQTFARKSLSKEALNILQQTSCMFFDQVVADLHEYTKHSKSKEILNIKSVYLLLKRQRQIDSYDSLLDIIDEMLPLENVLEIRRNLHKLQK